MNLRDLTQDQIKELQGLCIGRYQERRLSRTDAAHKIAFTEYEKFFSDGVKAALSIYENISKETGTTRPSPTGE